MGLGEAEKAALDEVLAGRDLIKLFTPQRRVTALLDELRRNQATRAIFEADLPTRHEPGGDETSEHHKTPLVSPRPQPAPKEQALNTLAIVVDYANGMTQQAIARKHGVHVQTVRKRLDAAGVVTRARSGALTEADVAEARNLLTDGVSAREIGRRLGVAHTTLLRSIRRSDATLFEKSTNAHHETPDSSG